MKLRSSPDMNMWNIYEISTTKTPIHGVKLRGRIRKFALQNDIELLTENASDKENVVRFAIIDKSTIDSVSNFVASVISDANVELVLADVQNPVLSKLKVNQEERYET